MDKSKSIIPLFFFGAMLLVSMLVIPVPAIKHPTTLAPFGTSTLIPTGPLTLSDNTSIAAVADSGTGTSADPFIIENRSFQLNYTSPAIIISLFQAFIVIRNCLINGTDPSGFGVIALNQNGTGTVRFDNCTMMNCPPLGFVFINVMDCQITNCILENNSGIIFDQVDNLLIENITLEDSLIASIPLTIGRSNNVTIRNVDCHETGVGDTTGIDFLLENVHGCESENVSIDCEAENCTTALVNCTNVTFDHFKREAPEPGLIALNVTGFDMMNSIFNMDDNNSALFMICNDINLTSSTFNKTGNDTGNLEFLSCTDITLDGDELSGGNNTSVAFGNCNDTTITNSIFISISNSTSNLLALYCMRIDLDGNEFHGGDPAIGIGYSSDVLVENNMIITLNNTGIEFINSTDAIFSNNTFSFEKQAFYVDNDTNVTITGNVFENMTSGGVFNSTSDLTGVNVTGNAYWDYFDINPGYDTYYFYEGQVLPNEYTTFPSVNDTMPFYSEYLFGARVDILPVADFIANATIIIEGDYVQFNFTGTDGNRPCTFIWDFGDMMNGSGENYSHQYSTPGTYFVCLNVTDSDGQSALMNKTAYIEVGESILADFYVKGFPHQYDAGIMYTFIFDGVASLLPSTYSWTFGDGKFSSGTMVSHKYQQAGTYMVTLVVTDSVGHTSSYSKTIVVRDNAGPEPPGPEPPVIIPLSAGWQGLLIGGIVIVGVGITLIFVVRSRSTRTSTRGSKGSSRASSKSRKGR